MTRPDFKSGDDMIELHAVKLWFVIDKEGKKDCFFDAPMVADQERAPESPKEDQRAHVPPVVLELGARMGQMTSDKVATVTMTKIFYDDNAPAPSNTP